MQLSMRSGSNCLTESGLTRSTRTKHRRILRLLIDMAPPFREMPLPEAIVCCLWLEFGCHAPSTLAGYLESVHGAMSRLPQYTTSPHAFLMSSSSVWRDAKRAAKNRIKGNAREPATMTTAEFRAALAAEDSLDVRALLILTWAIAGRGSDVTRLLRSEVTVAPDNTLIIKYHRGKSADRSEVAQIVHGRLTPDNASTVREWMSTGGEGPWLFHHQKSNRRVDLTTRLRLCLRRINVLLEQRSCRRGALTALAQGGMPLEDLLSLSLHSTRAMLLRYLGTSCPTKPECQQRTLEIQ
jgi:hypothetical protein